MPKKLNLKGKRFGRLVALKPTKKSLSGHIVWKCRCDCGNITYISTCNWNKIKSCGCLVKEVAKKRMTIHGMDGHPIYKCWDSLKQRCYNKNNSAYKNYGGRGIRVCNRWKDSFENFYEDMGDKPKGLTLDRIDNNGNYCKKNCRWATWKQQANNRRHNHLITFKGKTQTMAQWANQTKIKYHTIYSRIKLGWTIKNILITPIQKHIFTK